jgi:hypothetical protein
MTVAPKRTLMREDLSIINSRFYGAARTAATLETALAGIGADQRALLLCDEDDGVWTLDTDIVIPVNITLVIPAGVTIVGAGNLTINGYYMAYRDDWYDGSGVLTINPAFFTTRPVSQASSTIIPVPGSSVETLLLSLTLTVRKGDFIQFAANMVGEDCADQAYRLRRDNPATGAVLGSTRIKGDGASDLTAVIQAIENVTVTGPHTYYLTIESTTAVNVALVHFTGIHYRAVS